MLLQKGVTGHFYVETPQLDIETFKKWAYQTITAQGGKVLSFKVNDYPRNFFTVQMDFKDEVIFLLLNAYYPFLAFASSIDDAIIIFRDPPIHFLVFDTFYEVVSFAELSWPINPKSLLVEHDLTKAELRYVRYFQPKTVGGILFNCWD
ncbi:MAG: hypothetical protein RR595_10540 [Lysinibacillus sp.]